MACTSATLAKLSSVASAPHCLRSDFLTSSNDRHSTFSFGARPLSVLDTVSVNRTGRVSNRSRHLVATARFGGLFSKPSPETDKGDEDAEPRGTLKVKSQKVPAPGGSGTLKNLFAKPKDATIKGTQKETASESQNNIGGTLKLLFGASPRTRSPRDLPRDDRIVFVAGSTGKVGSRTVRDLIKNGYFVRAGTRNAERATEIFSEFLESDKPKPFWSTLPFFKTKSKKLIEIVEIDLEKDIESIEDAIRESGKIFCTIGASESEALSISAPYRIDGQATINLINAASNLGVNQFVLISSLGTTKIGFPAAILNLFWGVLVWKAKAEKALRESGLQFTIIRPGGMERPTDDYKLTHNLFLSPPDTLFGGQVSSLQIAELAAEVLNNPDASENKIVEAIAKTDSPLRDISEMLYEIPVSGLTQKEREVLRIKQEEEEEAKRQIELEIQAKREEEERIKEEKRLEEERAREEREREELEKRIALEKAIELRESLKEKLDEAKEKQKEKQEVAQGVMSEKLELERKVQEIRERANQATIAASEAKALQDAVLAAANQGRLLSSEEKEKIAADAREKARVSLASPASSSKPDVLPSFSLPWAKPSPKPAPALEEEKVEEAEVEEEKKEVLKEKKIESADYATARSLAQQKVNKKLGLVDDEKLKKEAEEKKAKAEEEERLKKEEEEKARLEAEAKAKAEEEEKARIEAEAKAKAEEEEKARIEAEAKAKAEEEEKARLEAEAKAKAEEEEKARLEAEAKAKAEEEERLKKEEEEKVRIEAEAKAEEEERLRLEAEAKAKEDEEKARIEAEAKAKAEEEAKAKAAEEEKQKEKEAKAKAERESFLKIEELRAKLDDVTLPSERENNQPVSTGGTEKIVLGEQIWTEDSIASALDKKGKGFFSLFPWIKSSPQVDDIPELETVVPEPEPEPVVKEVERPIPEPIAQPKPAAAQSSTDFPPSPTPLSPYTMFPDLKPPASPTPRPPTSSPPPPPPSSPSPEAKISSTDFPPSPTPLSPYTMYPGLKPPTSPTPLPPVSSPPPPLPSTTASITAKISSISFPPSPTPLSPYTMYPGLKPPTTPKPPKTLL